MRNALRGTYVGEVRALKGRRAILSYYHNWQNGLPIVYLAQFDLPKGATIKRGQILTESGWVPLPEVEPLCFGWHTFAREDFVRDWELDI